MGGSTPLYSLEPTYAETILPGHILEILEMERMSGYNRSYRGSVNLKSWVRN